MSCTVCTVAGVSLAGVQKGGSSYPARTSYFYDLRIDLLSSERGLDKKAPVLGKLVWLVGTSWLCTSETACCHLDSRKELPGGDLTINSIVRAPFCGCGSIQCPTQGLATVGLLPDKTQDMALIA